MSETVNAINESSGQDKRALLARLLREKANRVKYFPPSFAQQRLWLLHQFERSTPLYNMVVTVRLLGVLDLRALRQAFTEIIRRHESLRTTFAEINGEPMQVVHPAKRFDLQLVDLVALPAGMREAEARRVVSESSQVPFDLNAGPLLRAMLVRLEESEHVMLLAMHHIVSDGWSMNVLAHEVGVLYQAFCKGQPSPLLELPIQYADFSRWQHERLTGEVLEEHLDYWRRQLDGELPLLELPTDRPRTAVRSHSGSTYGVVFPKALSEQLRTLSRSERVTMFMLMLAAFKTLLYRYTGQPDIIVGTPVAGRDRIETESLIGFFINMVAMRSDLSDNPTFREFLRRTREVALGAYAHQEMPFDRLVDELHINRSSSHTPLFQVVFDLRTTTQNHESEETTRSEGQTFGSDAPIARFDLTLNVTETGECINGAIEYRTDLFDEATISRMLSHYQNLLQSICTNPDAHVDDLTLLSDAERQHQLLECNQTQYSDPALDLSLHQLIEQQVERTPGAIALVFEGERLSYRELNSRANQLAHHLRSLGVRPESIVGVLMERSTEMVVSLLAIIKAGAAYVPLDPEYPQERLSIMMEDAGIEVVLTQQHLLERLAFATHTLTTLCLDQMWAEVVQQSTSNPDVKVEAGNAAYMIYTSGSTGRPKGVINTHGGIVNRLIWMQQEYQLTEADRVLQKTTFSFDVSVWEFFWPLMTGARLVVPKPGGHRDASYLARFIREQGVTTLHFVPSMLQVFLEEREVEECKSVRQVMSSGEALSVELEQRFFERMSWAELHNLYGPTEAAVDVSYWQCEAGSGRRSVPIGRPIANTQLYVLDKQMEAVAPGVLGEIYIGGVGLARGYKRRPELTAEKFVPNPHGTGKGERLYRTGDLGRRLKGGEIEYAGRQDEQVKIRGFRIELQEVAGVLREHEGVRECVVITREQAGEKRLVAYVVWEQDATPSSVVLSNYAKERLPEYMVPSAFVMLESLPLTPNGKVDRKALPEPSSAMTETEFVAPRSIVEQGLAEIWATILRLDRISVHDNFFAAGGHSLLATKMISRVREAFQVDIQPRALFEAPTVAGLAEVVELAIRAGRGLEIPPFERVSREEKLPLSFAQHRLWFLYQLDPDSSAYNVPLSMRLQGSLDMNALERSLSETLRRHEALRTTFAMVDGEPVQLISPPAPVELCSIDLSLLPDERTRLDEARRLANLEAQQPFDLMNGPLLRVKLLRLSEDDHVLLLTMHHIVNDGWSNGILINEVSTLYRSYSEGRPSPLAELPIQYADFAHWQRQWLDGEVLSQQLNYWKEQLTGATPLVLPTDRPRPPVLSYRGAVETLLLEKSLVESLRELAQRQGVTQFMLMLAAFKVLLMRYTGQQDISVGTPISGRNWIEIEGLIGFFVNTLVMRTEVRGEESFEAVVRRVREVALDGYAHQDVPFEKLVEEIQPERDASRQPLFQVIFSMQNASAEAVETSGLRLSSLGGENRRAKFDLNFSLTETSSGIDAALEYNTDLFNATTVARMLAHFRNLLAGIVSNPKQAVSTLPLLSDNERRLILHDWNDTVRPFPSQQCIHQLFEAQVQAAPEATALIFEDTQLSYRELNERVNLLAHRLRGLGVGPEHRVALLMERQPQLIVSLLAILKAGGAYLPIDPEYPQERIAFMLADADVRVVLTQQHLAATVTGNGVEIVCVDTDWVSIEAEESSANPENIATAENLAYVIYTSGSTGIPKGVEVTHKNVARLLFGVDYARFEDGPRILHMASVSFDASTFEVWGALLHGGCCVLYPERVPSFAGIASSVGRHGIDTMWLTASLFNAVVDDAPESLAGVKQLLVGGEALSVGHIKRAQEQLEELELTNGYGPTESTTFTCCHRIEAVQGDERGIAIGRPIGNTQIYILDQWMEAVGVGVYGELYIGGEGLARGYLQRPELTAERFVPHPYSERGGARLYRTGDVCRYREDGAIEYAGRIDGQVKVRGHRIELGEIEAVMGQLEGVKEVVVMAREDEPGEKRLVAYVVSEREREQSVAELQKQLQERLPEYMMPAAVVEMEALPLTANGKVDRRRLPAPERLERVEQIAPRTEVEQVLAEIWEEVLGVEKVGVNENFFNLGGHSLLATQMVGRVRNAFEVNLSLRLVFESPTIEELAMAIETIILDELEALTDNEVQGQIPEAQMSIEERL